MAKREIAEATLDDLQATNEKYKLGCTREELLEYKKLVTTSVNDYNKIEDFHVELPPIPPRQHTSPSKEENKYKAWYVRCQIKEKTNGKLHGKRIAIKDNTAVAGIPMMNGSRVMEGYVPEYDATVVRRILEAGGEIIGKTTCEDLCLSGGSFYTTYGPVQNPHSMEHSAGGSSSGSGVVVAVGDADMAIGGDQGGSIRIPASSCGIVGLKPTHGLVPYTGAVPIVPCVDHLGPMTKNVADCALMLEVIAGYDDGMDYRQRRPFEVPEYSKLIYPHVKPSKKLKIGLLKEGVELCDADVQDVFKTAIDWLKQSDLLDITTISLPDHKNGGLFCTPVLFNGTVDSMIDGCGFGAGFSGLQSHSMVDKLFDGYGQHSQDMSEVLKHFIFVSDYIRKKHGLHHYAKSSSLCAQLSMKYNKSLKSVDVLIMPTLTKKPSKIPDSSVSVAEKLDRAIGMIGNTAIFDVTGHPALSLNCGYVGKLPVGLMIVGRHFDEAGVLNVASIFEEHLSKQ